jgi:hypothetical protein
VNEAIAKVIAERNVERLVHFTQLKNLSSILAEGLIPRIVVRATVPGALVNDAYRFDGRTWWNCLSATFPNSRMFFSLQRRDPEVEWCVLLISPRVLLEKEILFCKHNAADNRISKLADNDLRGSSAFLGIFEEIDGVPSRAEQALKDAYPTDVQAEILVRGRIDPEYLDGVVFRNAASRDKFLGELGNLKSHVSDQTGFYGDRGYYRKWGQGK